MPDYVVPTRPREQEWLATAPGEMSHSLKDKGHGAFTWFTLIGLRGAADRALDGTPDGEVSANELRSYVSRELKVRQRFDQTPQLVGDGDWVLVSGLPKPAPQAPAAATATLDEAAFQQSRQPYEGFVLGLFFGNPIGLHLGYELGRRRPITAFGVRSGVGVGIPIDTDNFGILPAFVYATADVKLAPRWDLEVGAGTYGSLALQYDPPSNFQAQIGVFLAPDPFFKGPALGLGINMEVLLGLSDRRQ